ncbi:hypothetical protein [Knoellia subterranea]|uniref:Uncharacterized protein n=1 Tax=Knoellia subterranea KCTC 19937 TaxID=1385521 RepID=A0A0A0JFH0_9MICO|nr:hypothetical protein [Knoellia subterranea]KGN36170.1 hypothetical protein N803_06170 [Knoellia subterranea KCTC 19937]
MTWFATLALLWLVLAALMIQARQRGSRRVARRWRTRLYAVSLVPLTALALGVVLVAVQLPGLAVDNPVGLEHAVAAATPYAQWLALVANLVVVDMALRTSTAARGKVTQKNRRAGGIRDREVHEAFTSQSA